MRAYSWSFFLWLLYVDLQMKTFPFDHSFLFFFFKCLWWQKSARYSGDQILIDTIQWYWYFLNKTSSIIIKRKLLEWFDEKRYFVQIYLRVYDDDDFVFILSVNPLRIIHWCSWNSEYTDMTKTWRNLFRLHFLVCLFVCFRCNYDLECCKRIRSYSKSIDCRSWKWQCGITESLFRSMFIRIIDEIILVIPRITWCAREN